MHFSVGRKARHNQFLLNIPSSPWSHLYGDAIRQYSATASPIQPRTHASPMCRPSMYIMASELPLPSTEDAKATCVNDSLELAAKLRISRILRGIVRESRVDSGTACHSHRPVFVNDVPAAHTLGPFGKRQATAVCSVQQSGNEQLPRRLHARYAHAHLDRPLSKGRHG